MTEVVGNAPAEPAKAPRRDLPAHVALGAAVALALGHLAWILFHFAPATMSPDANGYIVQGRLIATKGQTSFASASPVQFVGMHWLETEPGVFHSRYPAGLPMLFALAWKIGGLRAALLVNPLLASGTVLLVFFLARRFVGAGHALLAAAVVATVPVANHHALDADAHVAATFFLVAGVVALLRFGDTSRVGAGLLAGFLLGLVPTIRYPEAIVGFAVAAWLALRIRPIARVWPPVVGAAGPLLALLSHNAVAYGAFWRTGYALTNEQTGFGLRYFWSHALPYLQALGSQGLGMFFGFGAAGLAALACERRWRAEGLLFVAIVTPLTLLYMAYYFGGGPGGAGGGGGVGNMRFLIPTFPFFALGGVWLLARLSDVSRAAGWAAAIVAGGLQILIGVGTSTQTLGQVKRTLTAATRVQRMAEAEIPAGSIVIVDHSLAESLDAAGRWKLVEENLIGAGGPGFMGAPGGLGPPGGPGGFGAGPVSDRSGGGRGGREGAMDLNAPSPQQRGKNRAQQERYAGLRGEERRAQLWADVATWAQGKPVFWLARSVDAVDRALPAGGDYRSIAEVDAPAMMGPGMMGAGGVPGGPGGGGPDLVGRGGRGPGTRGMPGGGFGPGGGFFPGGGRGGGEFATAAGAKLRLVRIDLPKA